MLENKGYGFYNLVKKKKNFFFWEKKCIKYFSWFSIQAFFIIVKILKVI